MKISFEKKILLLFSGMLVGIVVAGIVTFRNNKLVKDTDYRVQHTRKVLYESVQVLSLAQDIVLSTRGYVITGDSVFLKPFEDANDKVHKHITKLEELTEYNPVQLHRTDSLKKMIEKRIEISLLIIRSRKEKGFEHAQQSIASRKGKFYMDEIRNTVHAIQQEENKLLNARQEANRESHAAFSRSFYFLLGAIVLLLIIVFFTGRHNLRVRKKAEEELKASEEKFRNLIHLSPVGITLSTTSGKILEANPEIVKMMGCATKEELLNTPVAEFFVDINDREKRIQLFKKDGYVKNYQSRVKRKDGRVIWVSGHVYPFKLSAGEVAMLSVQMDITEIKEADEKLITIAENLNEAQAITHVGNWEVDLNTGALIWSDELYRIYGFNKNETTPTVELFLSHVHPDDLAFVNEKADAVLKNFKTESFEFRIIRTDGAIRWLHTQNKVKLDATGKPLRLYGINQDITERKNAAEELFIKNEWFKQTLISLGDGVIATDVNGIITLINKAACELSGWTPEEAVGIHVDRVFEITNERTGLRVINPVTEAMQKNKIMWLANHTILKRKDGSTLFIDDSGAPIHNQKGEVIGGVLIFRDITEKKKAEEQLKEYLHFFNNSNDLCLIANMQGYFESINTNFKKVLGYSEKELKEKPFLEFVHPKDVAATQHEFEKVASMTGIVVNFLCRFHKKEGSYVWLEWNSIPNPDTGKIYAIGRDVTERKKAEELLKESENSLQQSQEISKMGSWEMDILKNKTSWSENCYRVYGLKPFEIEPTFEYFKSRIHPDDLYLIDNAFAEILERKAAVEIEIRVLFQNGDFKWFQNRIIPVFDSNQLIILKGTNIDITERKKAEAELLAYKNDLEKKVIERTEKLASSKKTLRELYEKLVKSESEIRNFAKHLNQVIEDERSHIAREIHDEIGQQLAGMKINFIHLKTPENGEKVQEMIKNVDGLIQTLRKIATQLRPGILDSLGLIPSIEWLAKEFENKTKIKCRLMTYGDEEKFEKDISTCFFRICQESLTNISKHAQASEVTLEINKINQELLLKIIDNGKGIASEKLENPFSMGLLGMRERARLIGADLKISSKIGSGTTVKLIAKIN